MHRTPVTSGTTRKPTTPSPATMSEEPLDAARTFIKRPEAKRRSIDNMDKHKIAQKNYAAKSNDLLLQDIMRTFEEIPSRVQAYPQMRRDIKAYLEEQSDRGLRDIFELSRRIAQYEAEATKTKAPTEALSDGPDAVIKRLGEVEASLKKQLAEMERSNKANCKWLNDQSGDRGSDMIDRITDRIDSEVRAAIDQSSKEVEGRSHALITYLVGGIAENVVAATRDVVEATKDLAREPTVPSSYASVAAAKPVHRPALHSMAITLEGGLETADEVLARVKKAVDARGSGLKVSKVRKAKNQTIILGCDTEDERKRVQEAIESRGEGLRVAPMVNKNPLVVLKDVFGDSEDDELIGALHAQNKDLFAGLPEGDVEIVIKYKKRTRNPNTSHIVLQVRPEMWQRMTEAGALYLDLQRVRVEDQSPVIQCTKCLAFGHGRKFCVESVDRCSHCGGPHLREKCQDFSAGVGPRCCNCSHSGLQKTGHNAFSGECPVRQKWDYLARTTTTYA